MNSVVLTWLFILVVGAPVPLIPLRSTSAKLTGSFPPPVTRGTAPRLVAAGKIVKIYYSPYSNIQGDFGHKNTLIFQLKFYVLRLNRIHNTIYGIITHTVVRIAGVHATLAVAHSMAMLCSFWQLCHQCVLILALLSHSALYYSISVNYIY